MGSVKAILNQRRDNPGPVRVPAGVPACQGGLTLIELLLAIALVIVVTVLALPVYSNYSVREKIAETLQVAETTKTIVAEVCDGGALTRTLQEVLKDHAAVQRALDQSHVQQIRFSGDCASPVITISTRNLGQVPSPVIRWSGVSGGESSQLAWRCESQNTPVQRLPRNCRS